MRRHPKPVQAQRKYAHKAFTPISHRTFELAQDTEQPELALPPPNILKTQRHVFDTLDIVSFQNGIHSHKDMQRKVPRVVLERCEFEVLRREPSPPPNSPPPARRVPSLPPPPVPAAPSSAGATSAFRRLKTQTPRTRAESPSTISLRNRRIFKISPNQKTKRKTTERLRSKPPSNLRTESEEDHPLAYYAKRARSQSANVNKSDKKNIKKKPNALRPNDGPGTSQVVQDTRKEGTAANRTYWLNGPGEGERGFSKNALISLYDFVVNIFDSEDKDYEPSDINDGSSDTVNKSTTDSIARVYEWLSNSNNNHKQQDTHFKLPVAPPLRVLSRACASVRSSSIFTSPAPPTKGERLLRATCVTWHHNKLCATLEFPSYIKRFCGECPRCKVMFKALQKPQSTRALGVYDFSSHPDEEERGSFEATLTNVAEQATPAVALKRLMTSSGRKILKVATMLQEDRRETGFTGREQILVAEVIGILTQCNAARITPPSPPPPSPPPTMFTSLKNSLTLHINETEFAEGPIAFSNKVLCKYPSASLCGLVPPREFKPVCTAPDEPQNFRVTNMYIHRMLTRWGPATQQLTAIRSIQGSNIQRSPLFNGLEVDLVKLFHAVQQEGGIENVQKNEEKWKNVARAMNLYCRNKTYVKLENIYLKYLLHYNTLTCEERQKALAEVNERWSAHEIKAVSRAQNPLWRQERMTKGTPQDDHGPASHIDAVCAEAEECLTPGRNININLFKKLAEQVKLNHFPEGEVSPERVESKFWSILMNADSHVCVHAGSVDAAAHATGFPRERAAPLGNHPWNLKRVRTNSGNLLSYLGPCLGVSSSSIHYGMCFSASCWHKDPTSVPWIEYLHEGAPKIWYSISAEQEAKFRVAAESHCPWAVQNKNIWLPSDIIMLPPCLLKAYNIEVERHVQRPGEYVIVYPNTYCANLCTGFTISEGVYFAPHSWLKGIVPIFTKLWDSCEPSLFPMEQLLMAMARHERTPLPILQRVQSVLVSILNEELTYRQLMADKNIELLTPKVYLEQTHKAKTSWQVQQSGECAYCRRHLYLSRVVGVTKHGLCSKHGLMLFEHAVGRRDQLTNVFCILLTTNEEIYNITNTLQQRMMGAAIEGV